MKILFICLGNICRSPLAEGLFRSHLQRLGMLEKFTIDSCGTGNWHAGELPDKRTLQTAEKNGIRLTHRARQLKDEDFDIFDHLLVMDENNYKEVIKLGNKNSHKVSLFTGFSATQKGNIIPDPYFGTMKDFEDVYKLIDLVSLEIAEYFYHQYRN